MTVCLELATGGALPLDPTRWRRDADDVEAALLDTLSWPVLDVGCGPGRLAAALAARGAVALGIDPAPSAVHEAARRGAPVLQRSVFGPLPGQGRWATALLVDGNIGIGGDPDALLRRLHELLRPGGVVVAEVGPPGGRTRRCTVRLAMPGGNVGPWFGWATVSADQWPALAARAGFTAIAGLARGGRHFARAVRP